MKRSELLCRPWDVTETDLKQEDIYKNETIFSLGNGYLGTRGSFEENYGFESGQSMEGSFINGFYESEPIRYGEFNYGFPRKSQSMLNVTNAKILRLFVDGEEFHLLHGRISEYERNLSLRKGILTRRCIWETRSHKRLRLTIRRLASFTHKHLLSILYEIEPLNFDGTVQLLSQVDPNVCNHTSETNPLIDYGPYGNSLLTERIEVMENVLQILSRVKNNGFYLYTGCVHIFSQGTQKNLVLPAEKECPGTHLPGIMFTLPVKQGVITSAQKQIIYTVHENNFDACREEGKKFLDEASSLTFAQLAREQETFLKYFWDKTDVAIDGDDYVQQGIRFNLFHILQATGRDGMTSVGAKGLSGEGYEGHVFWDTEMYVIPFYTHTCPHLSRSLLMYRYHTLDAARSHARELGHKIGALYPWRTINGAEASAYYPLGSAQYHINGDIAYAINQYGLITGDHEFIYEYGLEILCEISRVFADVGFFSEWKDGKYVISCVTGPDEYNAIVDNNFYTNLGARETLRSTLYWLGKCREENPDGYKHFADKLHLSMEEFTLWNKIIKNMYLGYDGNLDIYVQDDTYLQKKPWDPETDKEKKSSLLYMNYHPLYVFRHQICKQADTPMAMLLYSHLFTEEKLQKNYDYYYPRTLHHSSLSQCIYAIIESRLGRYESAFSNFITSARMDLDDCHNNVYAGIHAANMAGTWMTLTYGLAGMNTTDGRLSFAPYLPERWNGYSFKITYRRCVLLINVKYQEVSYHLLSGDTVAFTHNGKECLLTKETPAIAFRGNQKR